MPPAPAGQGESSWLKIGYRADRFRLELFEIMELSGTWWNFHAGSV
jgi:hypothetical protein